MANVLSTYLAEARVSGAEVLAAASDAVEGFVIFRAGVTSSHTTSQPGPSLLAARAGSAS